MLEQVLKAIIKSKSSYRDGIVVLASRPLLRWLERPLRVYAHEAKEALQLLAESARSKTV